MAQSGDLHQQGLVCHVPTLLTSGWKKQPDLLLFYGLWLIVGDETLPDGEDDSLGTVRDA